MVCSAAGSRLGACGFCVHRKDSGVRVPEGNYCDKPRQIGAIGLAWHYGFATIERLKIKSMQSCYRMIPSMRDLDYMV